MSAICGHCRRRLREAAERRRRWGENNLLLASMFTLCVALWWLRDSGVIP